LLIVAALGCALILCPLLVLAQLTPGVPLLEMAVSFLPQIILISAVASFGMAFFEPRVSVLTGLITLVAAWPFLSFGKYQTPTQAACNPGECLTVITANVFEKPEAILALGEIVAAEQPDLVALNETALSFRIEQFEATFPDYQRLVSDDGSPRLRRNSKALTFLSRMPVARVQRLSPAPNALRDLMYADLDGDWAGTRIVITHTMIPISGEWLQDRNRLIRFAGATAGASERFILMGDFNMTPWSPVFHDLPGRRAGDPRFTATWPSFFPVLGIPIDHIMASDDLELVEVKVLESIGSDHYPVLARYRQRN